MAYIGTIEALRGIGLAQSTDPAVVLVFKPLDV